MIEVLFGPIASGKTTYAHARAKDGALIVNDDAIVQAVHAGDYRLYDDTLKPLYKGVQLAIVAGAIQMKRAAIIDMPNLKRSTRDRWRLLAIAMDVQSRLMVFRDGQFLGEADGDRRFDDDSRGLSRNAWRKVGRRHALMLDALKDQELFSSCGYVEWEDPNDIIV